jgi:uncharacterized protein YlxP (DUF503 family)
MKSLFALSILTVMLVLAGCSDDGSNPVTPVNNPTQDVTLNGRAAVLYINGEDALNASKILLKEFIGQNKDILIALLVVGYSPEEIVQVVRIVYQYDPQLAEDILVAAMGDKTKAQIAELILFGYENFLKMHPEILEHFMQLLQDIDKEVKILKEKYGMQAEEILILLKQYGNDAKAIIEKLIKYYPLAEEEIKKLLVKNNFSEDDIINVLKDIYNRNAKDVFDFLKNNGYKIESILSSLKTKYNLNITELNDILKNSGYDVNYILNRLKELKFSLNDIADLLKDHYNLSPEDIAGYLKNLNANAEQIAQFLKDKYNMSVSQIAVILKDKGFNLGQIASMLKDYFSLALQEIIDILKSIGFSSCDVLNYFGLPCF